MSRGIRVEDHGRWFRNRRRFKRSPCSESCSQLHKGVLIVSITITRTAMAFCCEKKENSVKKRPKKIIISVEASYSYVMLSLK